MEALLKEVREMNNHFQAQESVADGLLKKCTDVQQKLQTLHQCEDGFGELNKAAGRRSASELLHGTKHESERMRAIEEENRDLRTSLEEHQATLGLVMAKYREQVASLVTANRMDRSCMSLMNKEQELAAKDEKIVEMALVMERAVVADEDSLAKEQELISKLRSENQGLRELLDLTSFEDADDDADDDDDEELSSDMKSHVLKHIPPEIREEDVDVMTEEKTEFKEN